MARLCITNEFLAEYARLQKPVQRAVSAAIDKFAEHTHAGLHLEKLNNARDPRIRTIRINQFYRGVVLAPDHGDDYLLLSVRAHDDAIAYAVSRLFTVNQTLKVLEVRDQDGLEEAEQSLIRKPLTAPPLFGDVSDTALTTLGIDGTLLPLVRALTTEKELVALAGLLPSVQHDVLTGLAAGMTPDEVWTELSARLVGAGDDVDVDDVMAAARRTPDRYAFVSGPAELAAILAHPFDAWRAFLHPTQQDIAYEPAYAGPVMVTGSAGTGKTVTALHRAVYLARRLDPDTAAGPKILVTTFTRSLADALLDQLALLTDDPAVRGLIEIVNVDRLAHRIVAQDRGGQPRLPDQQQWRAAWDAAAAASGGFTAAFLEREWEQIILAQGVQTEDDYLGVIRRGRGTALRPEQRRQVWRAISQVTRTLDRRGESTHLQLADEAAHILTTRNRAPYWHVVVDEGQDLHPSQWRLLRAVVPAGVNDMFIVADPYQRIYDNHVSLSALGVNVRGRSRKLKVNYRTTHEILSWSVSLLTGITATGLDDQGDSLAGYRSVTHGGSPRVVAHQDRAAEAAALVEEVKGWIDKGVEPRAIGVATRNNRLARALNDALTAAGVPAGPINSAANVVRVGTMHATKGLEFQCLAVAGVESELVPARAAVVAEHDDPTAHRQDLQRERCLLFVACTRARDVLYVSHVGAPSVFLGTPQYT